MRQLGKGVLQLGQQQHDHHHEDVEPRGLGADDGRQAVGDEGNDDGGHPEHVVARLLHVVVQRQQQSQHRAAAQEESVVRRVEDVEQVSQDADERKGTVGAKQCGLAFALQADAPLRKADEQGKEGHQHESDELLRQVCVDSFHFLN